MRLISVLISTLLCVSVVKATNGTSSDVVPEYFNDTGDTAWMLTSTALVMLMVR
jgi:hypothetical protein